MESDAFHSLTMKIEEAIVYVLAERNGGLKTEQIAEIINRRKLHVRNLKQYLKEERINVIIR